MKKIFNFFKNHFLSLHVVLFFAFIYVPLLVVIFLSFNSNVINMMVWDGFTYDWYKSIFGFKTGLDEDAMYLESTDQLLNALKDVCYQTDDIECWKITNDLLKQISK